MFVSGVLSLLLKLTPMGEYLFADDHGVLPAWSEYIFVVVLTTLAWLTVTLMTPPEEHRVLLDFYKRTRPGGPGWKRIVKDDRSGELGTDTEGSWSVPSGILAMLVGSVFIYSSMFSVGYWIYGRWTAAILLSLLSLAMGAVLLLLWKKIKQIIK